MKHTLALVLMVFGIVGCGYKDKNECLLKEQQKCDGGCRAEAYTYCEAKFPPSKEAQENAVKMSQALSNWKPKKAYESLSKCTGDIEVKKLVGNEYEKRSQYCKSDAVVIDYLKAIEQQSYNNLSDLE